MENKGEFDELLKGSAKEHGHMCPGQVIGVRMALLGLDLIGLKDPKNTRDIKKIIVYVEIDRCATDAISYVTGVKLGRRSLKFKDYGIMAATFINLETNKAYRILSTEKSRDIASKYCTHIIDIHSRQLEAYKVMTLSELFEVTEVEVEIKDSDMPGPSRYKATCEKCGIVVRDGKEVVLNNHIYCNYCADNGYYKVLSNLEV